VQAAAAPASRGYVPGKSMLSDLLDDSDDSDAGNHQAHAQAQPRAAVSSAATQQSVGPPRAHSIPSCDSDESRSRDPLPDALPAALPAALAPRQDGPLALFGLDLELSEGEVDGHDDADTEPGSDYFDSDESRDWSHHLFALKKFKTTCACSRSAAPRFEQFQSLGNVGVSRFLSTACGSAHSNRCTETTLLCLLQATLFHIRINLHERFWIYWWTPGAALAWPRYDAGSLKVVRWRASQSLWRSLFVHFFLCSSA
jgi:hypothetical protein